MNSVVFPRTIQLLRRIGLAGLLSLPLVGCVSDDMADVSQLQPYGGSKKHPIVIQNGEASVANCGDWSENLADTDQNTLAPNHGCAVQSNIAEMAVYPEDLAGGNRPSPPSLGGTATNAVHQLGYIW